MRSTILLIGTLTTGTLGSTGASGQVMVNGQRVEHSQFEHELGQRGIPLNSAVPDGSYWYDAISGLWGMEGGPTMGQLPPGMQLGGELQADASGGRTNVFINGRALHEREIAYLYQLFGAVVPGRFWMNAQGVGGMEGGPALFSIQAATQAKARNGGNSWTRRGLFGGMGSDGNCTYFISGNVSASTSGCG